MAAQTNSSKLVGRPTQIPALRYTVSADEYDVPGGECVIAKAAQQLLIGDLVYWNFGGFVDKTVNGSWYSARFAGVVVGGDTTPGPGGFITTDSGAVGKVAAVAGKNVVVQISGVAYVPTDAAAGAVAYGDPVISGQTTAGTALRLNGNLGSYITADPAFAIHGAASALGKVGRAAGIIISGVLGTLLTAATDTAALVGNVANALFNIYEARSTGAANQTTAQGTVGASLGLVLPPAAPAAGVATYGAIIINPTGVGAFVGGTTALDDAAVIPNAVFAPLVGRYKSLGYFIDTTAAAAGTAVRMRIQPAA